MNLKINEKFLGEISLITATISMCLYNYVVTLHWISEYLLYTLLIISIFCSWTVGLVYKNTHINWTKLVCLIFYIFLFISFIRSDILVGLTNLNWICILSYLFFIGANKDTMTFLSKIMVIFASIQCLGVLLQEFAYNVWYSFLSPALSDSGYLDYVIRHYNQGYVSGFSYNSGFTAIFIIDGLIGLMVLKSTMNTKIYYLLFVVYYLCLIMTGKRGELLFSILAIAVCYVALADDFWENFRRMAILLVIIIIIFGIGYILYINNVDVFNIDRILQSIYAGQNTTGSDISGGRFSLWANALNLFREQPFTGIGWWRFSQLYGMEVHNVYIQVLCELGIFAFIFYILMYFMSVNRFIKIYRKGKYEILDGDILKAILIFLIYFGLMGLVENVMSNPEFYYMFFFMIGYTINSNKRDSTSITVQS